MIGYRSVLNLQFLSHLEDSKATLSFYEGIKRDLMLDLLFSAKIE